jgi:hypothetical protein
MQKGETALDLASFKDYGKITEAAIKMGMKMRVVKS